MTKRSWGHYMGRITIALERIAHALEAQFKTGATHLNFESLDPDKFVEGMDNVLQSERDGETTQPDIQVPLTKHKKPNGV